MCLPEATPCGCLPFKRVPAVGKITWDRILAHNQETDRRPVLPWHLRRRLCGPRPSPPISAPARRLRGTPTNTGGSSDQAVVATTAGVFSHGLCGSGSPRGHENKKTGRHRPKHKPTPPGSSIRARFLVAQQTQPSSSRLLSLTNSTSTTVLDEMMDLQVRPRPLETPVLGALPNKFASA